MPGSRAPTAPAASDNGLCKDKDVNTAVCTAKCSNAPVDRRSTVFRASFKLSRCCSVLAGTLGTAVTSGAGSCAEAATAPRCNGQNGQEKSAQGGLGQAVSECVCVLGKAEVDSAQCIQ